MADVETAIRVEGVYKDFVLPHERVNSIKSAFMHTLSRSRGSSKETQHALKNVSFDIKKGEFFGIVGRNGSGKSTLLKILAGIYQPTHGRIVTSGKIVPFIELGVGFNGELSGRENVYLNGAIFGFTKREIDSMYEDIVSFAELERFMDQKLKNYSSGMQVRLAFSMATRSKADILLIDEVLAVGDADFQRKCYEYFNQLKKTHQTVVFVSHDMDAVERYCDRGLLLEKSKIMMLGNIHKVASSYNHLFIEQRTEEQGENQNGQRWGDGWLRIAHITVNVSSDVVTITEKVKATRDVNSPTAGIRIRSSSGQPITGTSSELEQVAIPDLKSGESLIIEWRMPNIFSDGNYSIDPAIAHNGGAVVSDWWDEATSFIVKKERTLPYPVDPKFELRINKP